MDNNIPNWQYYEGLRKTKKPLTKLRRKEILDKVEELKEILIFFNNIKEPSFSAKNCPFKDDHYHLSEATNGCGQWCWYCPLCGEEEQE